MDREGIEKDRLRERRFGYQQYEEPGPLVRPDARDSALYQEETDRFFTDVAAEERYRREEKLAKKNAEYARRREEAMLRDEERWRQMEAESRQFDEKTIRLQSSETAALKNKSGTPYDPVSGGYEASTRGEAYRQYEQRQEQKAGVRAHALDAHSRSAPYNPLTGAPVPSGAHHGATYRYR